jgi:hypothetical protein
MRKILDTRDWGYATLSTMVAAAREGRSVMLQAEAADEEGAVLTMTGAAAAAAGMPAGDGAHAAAAAATAAPRAGAAPAPLVLTQEGVEVRALPPLPSPPGGTQAQAGAGGGGRGARSKQRRGEPAKQAELPPEMAERLLQAYPQHQALQQQRQAGAQNGAPGSSAAGEAAPAAAAAAAAGGAPAAPPAPAEPPLLPKEVFVCQLVGACCGHANALKQEKVVIFSQVRPGRARGAACCRALPLCVATRVSHMRM